MSSDSNNPCSAVVSADDVPAPANTTTATAASIALTGVNNKNGSSTIINRSATTTTTAPPQTTTTLATATTTTTTTTTAAAVAAATTSAAAPSQSTSSSTTTNNTLSPFDLSGLGMGFGLYRPRRPSYTFATKCNRQRNESYRHATRRENLDSTSEPMSADGDFIEDVLRSRTRKISYIKATKFSEEYGSTSACGVSTSHVIVPGSDGDDDDDYDDDDDVLRIEDGTRGGSQLSVHSRTSGFETIKVTLNNHSDNILTNANNDEDVVFCESQNYLNHKSAQNCPSLQGSKVNSLGRGDSKSTGTWRSSRFKLEGSKNVSNIISTFTFHKNVIVLCCSFILVFSSFQAIQNLQSSMNSEGNLGIYTMMSVHIAMIFSCLVSPIIINLFTAKWALCIGIHCFLIWFGANFHPTFYTLIPTSMFVGLGKGILWSAENAYVLRLACESSRVKRTTLESEMFRFHGIFLACFQTTHIWGNLISSLVLSSHAKEVSPPMSFPDMGGADGSPGYEGEGADGGVAYPELPANQSSSYYSSYDRNYEGGGMSGEMPPMLLMSQCGALHRCGKAAMTIFPGVMQDSKAVHPVLWKLMTSYIVLGVVSFGLIVTVLDRIGARADPEKSPKQIVVAHLSQLFTHPTLRLLIPLLLFNGLQQGFIYSDYNQYFVTCTLGIHYVGYCMITLGGANVLAAIFVAVFANRIPREVVLGFGGIVHIALMIGYLIWIPEPKPVLFFVLAAAWGVCDAVWQTQCNTLICLTCVEEPEVAFNNFRLIQSLGLAVMFGCGSWLCVSAKLYLLMTLLVVAIMFYVLAEYRLRHSDDDVFEDP